MEQLDCGNIQNGTIRNCGKKRHEEALGAIERHRETKCLVKEESAGGICLRHPERVSKEV